MAQTITCDSCGRSEPSVKFTKTKEVDGPTTTDIVFYNSKQHKFAMRLQCGLINVSETASDVCTDCLTKFLDAGLADIMKKRQSAQRGFMLVGEAAAVGSGPT